jgi:dTDP-4-amino-4,6-dideoxygalactose transaminase
MDAIMNIAQYYNLKVIEDCAQAMGSFYKQHHVGSIADAGILSFFPTKILGCYGDGGMVITNNALIAKKVRQLRNHGSTKKYHYSIHGFNSRLDEFQAGLLRIKLKHIIKWIQKRKQIAFLYNNLIRHSNIICPHIAPYTKHSFNYYTIRIKQNNRNKLQKYLSEHGISTEIYYPLSLHLQKAYKYFGYKKGSCPIAEQFQNEVLSLPIYPELTEKQVTYVCKHLTNYFS